MQMSATKCLKARPGWIWLQKRYDDKNDICTGIYSRYLQNMSYLQCNNHSISQRSNITCTVLVPQFQTSALTIHTWTNLARLVLRLLNFKIQGQSFQLSLQPPMHSSNSDQRVHTWETKAFKTRPAHCCSKHSWKWFPLMFLIKMSSSP